MGKEQSYIWKYAKERNGDETTQKVVRLIDMSDSELKNRYEHCIMMLENTDKLNPGRYVVLNEIKQQLDFCGVELFIRYLSLLPGDMKYSRQRLLLDISEFIRLNSEHFKKSGYEFIPKEHYIHEMFDSIPQEFNKLNLNDLLNGAMDYLGKFNRNHLTNSFIYKQGIWLTKEELIEFTVPDINGNPRDKLDLIKERLGLNSKIELHINPKGLTFDQFRGILNLKNGKKYSELTTVQLETLRYKILHLLEATVKFHINQWETKIMEILEIANLRNLQL